MIELNSKQQQQQQLDNKTLDQGDRLEVGRQSCGERGEQVARLGTKNHIEAESGHLGSPSELLGEESCITELRSSNASTCSTGATNNDSFVAINGAKIISAFEIQSPTMKQTSAKTSISSNGISSCSPESLSSSAFSSSSPSMSTLSPSPQVNKCHRNKNVNLSSVAEPERRYRPQKYCAVCGDKAIACNFNAVTCESCKAFFRRNAFKEQQLKCLFENSCVIDRVTRRFCSKCRLLKCFKIGMKREWILTDEQKQIKRVKIMQNKQSRQQVSTSTANMLVENELASSESRDKFIKMSNQDDSSRTELKSVLVNEDRMPSIQATETAAPISSIESHGEPTIRVNKFGIETKDAATSCPDETDLQTESIGHYCSLSHQCRFCSSRISSFLRPTGVSELHNSQYLQYDCNQLASTYHHHYTHTLNHQRPTQMATNSDIQANSQISDVINSHLANNGGSSQIELANGGQHYSLAPLETCPHGCGCQSSSAPVNFNTPHQHDQLQHGQQNFQTIQSSSQAFGQMKQALEFSTPSSNNLNCNQHSPPLQITLQPELHVLKPASETRTTSAVNLTRTKSTHCPNSRDTSKSDSQWSNQNEDKMDTGDRGTSVERLHSLDPEQTSSCPSISIKNAGQSSSSQSYQNPFAIALEAMNVADLAYDQRETECSDYRLNSGGTSNLSQGNGCSSSCSYEDQTYSLPMITKLADTSSHSQNRPTTNAAQEKTTISNPLACEPQSSSQAGLTNSQMLPSKTLTRSAVGTSDEGSLSNYVVWKGETYYNPATTEEDAISRVERLDFSDSEKHIIHEMIDATRFIYRNTTDRVCIPTKLDDMVHFCDAALRRLIKSVKQIRAFRILSMDDQIKLLKTACFKILLLRSAFHFREEERDENTGRKSCLELLKESKKSLVYEKHFRLLDQIALPLRTDRIILATLAMALLFEPDINLRHTNSVGLDNLIYLSILRKYLLGLQPDPLAKYERLISALQLLDDCNDEYNVFFSKDFQPEQVTPLLIEIFDIPINNSN